MKKCLPLLLVTLSVSALCQQVSPRYELVKMDKTVNTFHHEAAPVVSPDGKTLYFFVQDHPENTLGKDDTQDIWMSEKDANGVWGPAQHLRSPFNIHPSNQVFTVLPDGGLFIRGGRSKGEKGFSIASKGGGLTELEVVDFKKMNQGRFYGASISADRKHIILYFSEKDGSAVSDLYASHLQGNGSYSRPEKLKLSTNLDEVGPFIGPDQKTLFFGSARQAPGRQGGVDIYKCTRLDDTWNNWSEPVNMGKPINTSALDFYFTMDEAGNVFTSRANKALEGAQLDLYMLVPKTIKINLVGMVYNQKTNTPLQADVEVRLKEKDPLKLKSNTTGKFETKMPEVTEYVVSASAQGFLPKEQSFKVPALYNDTTLNVEILLTPVAKKLMLTGNVYDKKTEKTINAKLNVSLRSDRKTTSSLQAVDGKYEQPVPKLGTYLIAASAEGYMNTTDSVSIDNEELTPVTKDVYLEPIEVGVTVRLKNIYFDFDKTTLKKESFTELNKVVDFLKQNNTVEVEISGHTDSKGSDDYNLNLSQGRSQAVVDYIASQGIESHRLTAHGYGEAKPIDTNDTPDGQANNRRVEFTVLKK
ncbi:OmpA family protein [Fulvivirgaceae bacterium PWU4]|uniref:OmpA family protein n=1 Tax=Chryseosolibacter histidini TaxID=2782349 RepID=A0AAP2DR16_9BACT|nr:OmpA family protein [Chryseosolibacter histidini]MBT1699432.1 OmpA family protein [Chryseosolibacter histidini]